MAEGEGRAEPREGLLDRASIGLVAVAVLTLVVASFPASNPELMALREPNEPDFHRLLERFRAERGFFSPLWMGAEYAYGWLYWVFCGLGSNFLRIFGFEHGAITWPRLFSVAGMGVYLAGTLGAARRARLPGSQIVALLTLVLSIPCFLYSATRMAPEAWLLALSSLSLAGLVQGERRLGGWFHLAVFLWAMAIGIKLPAITLGGAFLVYILISPDLRAGGAMVFRAASRSVGAFLGGFLLVNLPLLRAEILIVYIQWMIWSQESNRTNHGNPWIPGELGPHLWFRMAHQEFIVLPGLALLTALALWAAWREWKSARPPWALVGLAVFWPSFLFIAFTVFRGKGWDYYLTPAFAGLVPIAIGGLVALNERFPRIPRWVWAVALVGIAAPRMPRAFQVLRDQLTIESTGPYTRALGNVQKVRSHLETLGPREKLVLSGWFGLAMPMRAAGIGQLVTMPYYGESLVEHIHRVRPDVMVFRRKSFLFVPSAADVDPGFGHEKRLETYQQFRDLQQGTLAIDGRDVSLRRLDLGLVDLEAYDVTGS